MIICVDKLTVEQYAQLFWEIYSIPSFGLRFFNVYGPRQDPNNPYSGVISIFTRRLLKNEEVFVNGGYQVRDFIFVKDICDVLYLSMIELRNKRRCKVFNVGTGNSTSINELLNMLLKIIKSTSKINYRELPLGDPKFSGGNLDSLEENLKTKVSDFTNLEDGLSETVNYFIKKYSIH